MIFSSRLRGLFYKSSRSKRLDWSHCRPKNSLDSALSLEFFDSCHSM
ncbi:AAEL017222-PA [Aedes aegypti]|uniref:AAEL017222-PA n=1 Tax=Aedes aegypti TaxID=7159 RepID=J9HJM4_AEDAE|nr:AAEL017222-PA [Aedes aegypti]